MWHNAFRGVGETMSLKAAQRVLEFEEGIADVTADAGVEAGAVPASLGAVVQPRISMTDPMAAIPQTETPHDPDHLAKLNQKLDDVLRKPAGPVWKPANVVDASKIVSGGQTYKRVEGDAKQAAAIDMRQKLETNVADIVKEMAVQPPEAGAKADSAPGSMMRSAGQDMLVGGAVTAALGLPGAIAYTALSGAHAGIKGPSA